MHHSFKNDLNGEEKLIYLEALLYTLKKESDLRNDYIPKLAKELGVTVKELRKLGKITKPESISNELLRIKDVRLRRYFVREMIMLAIFDHELADEEMCIIYKIGTAIGIKEDKINDFFLWAAQGIEWQMDGIRMVEDDL